MVGRTWWAERLKQLYLILFISNRCQTGSFVQSGMMRLSATLFRKYEVENTKGVIY